ncbi:hypothetical protein C9374_004742 [Naegleria lovaniensis]|uniref:Lipase n=1 Tax=Naegleria lovaniensis TaxID=51637 RepID=A0AA88KKN4_NAELO|nr:uncharacterized protein C9374_004742 [Naegleria lovaniensis]KAG2382775.1 hypothetical protein C9374_004742 [Naegleria lovaniensis]
MVGTLAVGRVFLLASLVAFMMMLVLLESFNTDSFVLAQDPRSNVTQLIQYWGYPVEQHYVQTEDGFILSVQRIPHGRSATSKMIPQAQRRVVFLQHGFLDCSSTWVNNLPYQSLGFILADAGYDVWLGNVRGNEYSNRNIHYTNKDKQFWQFSWDEMAAYDLPAMVNYALRVSGQQKLAYVGHSQGTTMAFECFTSMADSSTKYPACPKDFTDKISIFIAIAPVTFLQHVGSDLAKALAKFHVDQLLELLGVYEFLPTTQDLEKWIPGICSNSILQKSVCLNTYCLMSGCDGLVTKCNQTRLPLYMDRLPAGTSTYNAGHWAQLIRSAKFQMFDYGNGANNYQHYHQFGVPQIDLTKLHVDIAIYHGGLDVLGDVQDFQTFINLVPKERVKNVMFLPDYGHIDLVWGIENYKHIFADVVKRIGLSFN